MSCNNANMPLVSVIVSTYNQENTIRQTLDSILSQKTEYPYEIIIGEDASPNDNTRGICEQYVEKHPDIIRLMPKAPNKGLIRNYIDCLHECRGRYIAQCAGDDWWNNNNKLQMQVDYIKSHPTCVLIYTNYDIYKQNLNTTIKRALPPESLDTTGITDKLMRGFFLPPLTIMFCARMLQYIDFEQYIERGYMAEDLPMFLEFSLHGDFGCIDISTATYRAEAGSLSHFKDAQKMEQFLLNIKQIKLNFLIQHPGCSQTTSEELTNYYNLHIFRSAFAIYARKAALNYGHQAELTTLYDRVSYIICKHPLMWKLYVKLKKMIVK